jgi:protein TonB
MHLAFLVLLPNETTEIVVAPPQPIRVDWISVAAETKAAPPPAKAMPAPERVVKKPKPKPKPKPLPKASQPKPVSTTSRETAAPLTLPTSDPEPQLPVPTATQPTQAAESVASTTDSDNKQAGLTLPNLHADYLNNPALAYPDDARRQGEQGRVLLRVFVNAEGSVEQLSLRKSSGYPSLDRAALETVKTWHFVPAQPGTEAVAAWVVVPISFSLEG